MKCSEQKDASESANAFVIVPFDTEDDARQFAADIEAQKRAAIVARGRRTPWSADGRDGSELTFEGWRAKIAAGGTVVITDRV